MRSLALLLVVAALAAAEPVTLETRDGKSFAAQPVSFDADGLVVTERGSERRIPWGELTPLSAFSARRALTSFDDGESRLALSEFAGSLGLFPEAIRELEVALGLGGVTEAEFEKRKTELEEEDLNQLATLIDRLVETGDDPSACLAAVRHLKERYPGSPLNAQYAPLVQKLVDELAQAADEVRAEKDAVKDLAAQAELAKKVAALDKKKTDALAKAKALFDAGVEAAGKGQVSRARRSLVEPLGAERLYKEAREALRRIARTDKAFKVVTKDGLRKEYDSIERSLIECYVRLAKVYMRERNYKGAAEYVRKVLLYDPIHEEALEMADEIRKNRIVIKVSDLTNTKPRVTGG